MITGGKTYAAAASTRRESRSVQCQTSLTWVFSDRPLRTTESNVRSSGGPGSVSTGTQSSSGKSRTVSVDARVPCESAKCSLETDRGSADPPKTASRGSANPHKMASKGSAAPSRSAPKGSAGPLKTAASKDDSSSSRRSPTKVRVDGVLVTPRCFRTPGAPLLPAGPRCHPSQKFQTGRARRRGTSFSPTNTLPCQMMKWNRHQFFKDEIMVYFIIQ